MTDKLWDGGALDEKNALVNIQLEGIKKLLNATILHQEVLNSKGESCKRIVITYDERSKQHSDGE